MRRYFIASGLAAALALSACAFNPNAPLPQPSQVVASDISGAFVAADAFLSALPLVPGMPAAVVVVANKTEASLKQAWRVYQANPNDPASVKALQVALAAAESFITSQGKPAVAAARARAHLD